MSRRHRAEKREVVPDPKFANMVVSKFMNSIMHAGKKSVAETIVYGALDMIEDVDIETDTDIAFVHGRRVWDSRGRPTVEAELLLGDGSVRFVKNSINMPVWLGLNTIGGGEVISSDAWQ